MEIKTDKPATIQAIKSTYIRSGIYIILVFFSSLIACAGWLNPLFPRTHEHFAPVYTLMDFDNAFKGGDFLVNWLPNLAGGGQPVFTFYPPLAYYFAEFLHILGFSYTNSIKTTIIISFFISGIFMFIYVNKITNNRTAAFISAVAYIFFPYHLVDSHLRGDLTETFSFIFLPLIFYYLHEATRNSSISSSIYAGISYALLILTHILVAYIFILFIFIYFVLSFADRKSQPRKLFVLFAVFSWITLTISSFYWVPALIERDCVNFAFITSEPFNILNHYIYIPQLLLQSEWVWGSSGPGLYNTMPLGLGLFSIIIIIFSLALFLNVNFKGKNNKNFFIICVLLSCLFTTNYGLPILKIIPLMENIQFPWRFLIVTAFACSVLAGYLTNYLFKDISESSPIVFILFFMVLISSYNMISIPGGYIDVEPNIDDVPLFYRDEYLPVYKNVVYDALPNDHPDIIYDGKYALEERRSTYWKVYTYSNETLKLEMKIFYSPHWNCFIDGNESIINVSEIGTIYFNAPAGHHIIELKYCNTIISAVSKMITIIGLISSLVIFRNFGGK